MSGYYFDCPSCSNVHPIDPKPLIWFDVNLVRPEDQAKLLSGAPVNALPAYRKDAIGSITRLPLPDRQCDDCGQDGCVDCIPNALCKACRVVACQTIEDCTDPMKCQECPKQ